ncbi:hypothetical protein HNP48_004144 [Acidovorax soli]|uniref:Peptidase A2 domain-containing protein n=1 Tax=Acidovorax soli TaxID=592050 RepID=A0A7X0UAN6_9BURK|nr:aspartyl protease family protein [Acidovorax soli]MBB6561451.1 hypothetical protein [Acidovorax soli]
MRRRHFLGHSLLSAVPLLAACGGSMGRSPEGEALAGGPTTLPLQRDLSHVSVVAQANGRPLRLLLDTGADQHVLTPRTAEALGLVLSEERVPSSGAQASDQPVPWTRVDEIVLGGSARLRQALAFVIPLPAEFAYDGILGAPLWRAFTTHLDFARGEFTLDLPGRMPPPPGAVRLPLQVLPGGKLLVQASAAGHAGWFSLDTGDSGAVTLFRPTVERLGLRAALQPAVRMPTGVSVGGITWADVARLPQFGIGPWQLPQVPVHLALATDGLFGSDAWMGNLGNELWRRFALTIDVAGGALYLDAQAALGEPFAGPRSGLLARWNGTHFEVLHVLAGGPADQAGLRSGDALLAVQGHGLGAGDAGWLRERLAAPPGTALALRLRGPEGAERQATLVLQELV